MKSALLAVGKTVGLGTLLVLMLGLVAFYLVPLVIMALDYISVIGNPASYYLK